MKIIELWQFPIKGFGGSKTEFASLKNHGYFPNDRRFAISVGNIKTSNASPGTWFPKAHFLQLMSHEALAGYTCRYEANSHKPMLELLYKGKRCLFVDPENDKGRQDFENFIAIRFCDQLNGQPRLMQTKDQAYSDQSKALISIASKASLTAFANATNTVPDNRRFRINIITDAESPFTEVDMIGKTIRCGGALLMVKKSVGRCAAINVDPKTARRSNHDYVKFMREYFGHSNLGVFAEVINGGTVSIGNALVKM